VSVAVVGGGVTGLAAAYRLSTLGHAVTLYEADSQVGGVARSERRDGYLAEAGPNSLSEPDAAVRGLLEELGLTRRALEAAPAARKRYVVRGGRPVALPSSPSGLLTTGAFSLRAILSILREPFVPAGDPGAEESIAEFVRRRFGQELLDYGAGPFVGGIYAGDPAALSTRHAMPRLFALEQEHGSILKGVLARRRKAPAVGGDVNARAAARSISFPEGMAEIPRALAARLGDRVRTGAAVRAIARDGTGWTARVAGMDIRHDAIVCAGPAHAFGGLRLEGDGGALLAELASIPYAPVAVVVLGFRRAEVAHPLDGFGVLVPAVERRRALGVLFSSTMFPGRAPDGCVTLTTFVGGARQPQLAALDPDGLVALVRQELDDLLGARGEPTFRQVVRWPRAIPQFVLGYERWLRLMDEIEAANAGLFLAGSYRCGVGLGEALRSGLDAALRIRVPDRRPG
jgi:protoporphyrinogen/coproporphyrinogen III oxidase